MTLVLVKKDVRGLRLEFSRYAKKEAGMKTPETVRALETLGRVRLSDSFFMRDFLYSEISQIEGIPNIPENPEKAIEAGTQLCTQVLEPIQKALGRISIRSGYRSPAVCSFSDVAALNFTAKQPAYKLLVM